MLPCGHTKPLRKKRMTEKNRQHRSVLMRCREKRTPKLMAKQVVARMNGRRKRTMSTALPNCGRPSKRGIIQRSKSETG